MSKVNAATPKKNGGFEKKGNFSKTDRKPYKKPAKPTFVKIQVPIAYSDFYADSIDSLYNLLNEISFNLIAIPVKMSRSELTGDSNLKGTTVVGTVVKFNNDNTFTVSMTEENANAIADGCVMSIRCRKDRNNGGEITYVSDMCLTYKYDSIDNYYKDIEEAFTNSEDEIDNIISPENIEEETTTVEETDEIEK